MGSCFAKWACSYAEDQIGYTEGPNNWNKFADELDSVNYFEGCGNKQNLPWCAVFVNDVIYNACTTDTDPKWTAYYVMYQNIPNTSAVVSYMANFFKNNDAYFTDTQDLQRGDIVFFQNDDTAGFFRRSNDRFFVNRLDGIQADQTAVDALCGKFFNCFDRIDTDSSGEENSGIFAVTDQ